MLSGAATGIDDAITPLENFIAIVEDAAGTAL
jgi:hypothetical protein